MASVERELLQVALSMTWPTVMVSVSIWGGVDSTWTVVPAEATESLRLAVADWATWSVKLGTLVAEKPVAEAVME